MATGFDCVQDNLREPRHSRHSGRGEAASRSTYEYEVHAFYTEERKERDRDWLESAAGRAELGKRKYKGQYLCVGFAGVAGFGDTIQEAGRRARCRTGTEPAEMIEVFVPTSYVDF
jgi:hypothetical protein